MSKEAYVYIIGYASGDGPVKIGMSADVQRRLLTLQGSNPKRLVIYAKYGFATRARAWAMERRLHGLLQSKNLRGEWFEMKPKEAMDYAWKVIDRCWRNEEIFGILAEGLDKRGKLDGGEKLYLVDSLVALP